MSFLKDIFTPQTRRYLYRVSLALITLLATLGVVSQEVLPAIVGLIAAVFAISIADGNIPEPEKDITGDYDD